MRGTCSTANASTSRSRSTSPQVGLRGERQEAEGERAGAQPPGLLDGQRRHGEHDVGVGEHVRDDLGAGRPVGLVGGEGVAPRTGLDGDLEALGGNLPTASGTSATRRSPCAPLRHHPDPHDPHNLWQHPVGTRHRHAERPGRPRFLWGVPAGQRVAALGLTEAQLPRPVRSAAKATRAAGLLRPTQALDLDRAQHVLVQSGHCAPLPSAVVGPSGAVGLMGQRCSRVLAGDL